MTEHPIFCSQCLDVLAETFVDIIPQSTCEWCKRKCLGYRAGKMRELRADVTPLPQNGG